MRATFSFFKLNFGYRKKSGKRSPKRIRTLCSNLTCQQTDVCCFRLMGEDYTIRHGKIICRPRSCSDDGQLTFAYSSWTRFLRRGRTFSRRSQYSCRSGFLPLSQIIIHGSRPSVSATHAAIPPCLRRRSDSVPTSARRVNVSSSRLAVSKADKRAV